MEQTPLMGNWIAVFFIVAAIYALWFMARPGEPDKPDDANAMGNEAAFIPQQVLDDLADAADADAKRGVSELSGHLASGIAAVSLLAAFAQWGLQL